MSLSSHHQEEKNPICCEISFKRFFSSFFQKYIFSNKKKETQVKEYYSKPEEMGQNVTTFIAQTQLPLCNFHCGYSVPSEFLGPYHHHQYVVIGHTQNIEPMYLGENFHIWHKIHLTPHTHFSGESALKKSKSIYVSGKAINKGF